MILQALKEYYDRKPDLPRLGLQEKEIPYIVSIKRDGTPIALTPTHEGEGKKRRAKRFLVPQAVKKTSGVGSNLLWENPEYALGVSIKGKTEVKHAAFLRRIENLGDLKDEGIDAVKQFLALKDKQQRMAAFPDWNTVVQDGLNISFQLAGDDVLVCQRPKVIQTIMTTSCEDADPCAGICLITGSREPLERLHIAIKGVRGAQTSGANIVSFNLDAFNSYGKEQGFNAPVSKSAAFAYTTAINHLLDRDSRQKMQIGDATTIFWAARDTSIEEQMADFFSEAPKDDPDRNVRAVESLFRSVESGAFATDKDTTRFYVLGLAPNASRIAVRFWIASTVAEMAAHIRQHFIDLRITHGQKEKDILSLFRLLLSTAVQSKADNISPNLAGDTMRAILQGLPYPQTLLQAAIRRIRAEHDITYPRAALIKACINRSIRFSNPLIKEELAMSLNPANINIGYRLGRLFATLEKIQQEASPGINATIRDKFYGAASSTPVTVFGNLMRLKNHHLAKLEHEGCRVFFEKLIGEIMDSITDFPSHLPLADQGRFAVGYYHQMQEFYTKKNQ